MKQIDKLNVEGIALDIDTMDVFTDDGELVCGVEFDLHKNGTIYVNLYFDGKPFRYDEGDIEDSEINEDVKLALLNCFEEYREIIKDEDDDYDPRDWKEPWE